MPDDVVVSCALAAGVALERPLLRRLRAELRAAEALGVARRALRARDLSRRRLAERLGRAGVAPVAEQRALAKLTRAGALDDARLARARVATLAERGWGDRAIAARLEAEGLDTADAAAALATLAPELERATRVAARAKSPRRAWSLLTRRGFDPETIEALVGALDEDAPGGLG